MNSISNKDGDIESDPPPFSFQQLSETTG